MTRRFFRWLSLSCLAAVVLLFCAVYYLLATQAGSLTLLSWGAQRLPAFSYESAQGSLLRGMAVEGAGWHFEGGEITTKRLLYRWNWQCVMQSRLCLQRLEVAGINVHYQTPTAEPVELQTESPDTPLSFWQWPVLFSVEQLIVMDGELNIDNSRYQWRSLQLGVSAFTDPDGRWPGLKVEHLQLDEIDIGLAEKGSETPPQEISLPELNLPLLLEVSGAELNKLQISKQSEAGEDAVLLTRIDTVALDGSLTGSRLHIEKMAVAMPEYRGELKGDATLSGDYPIDLSSEFTLPSVESLAHSSLDLTLSGTVRQLQLALGVSEPVALSIEGQIEPLEPSLPFKAEAKWQRLRWPVSKEEKAVYTSPEGALQIKGDLDHFSYQLNGKLQAQSLPELNLSGRGEGDLHSVSFSPLQATATGEEITLNGRLSWQNGIDWLGRLHFNNINPGRFIPDLDGQLSGLMDGKLAVTSAAVAVDLREMSVAGSLSEVPVSLSGEVEGEWFFNRKDSPFGHWKIPSLSVSASSAQLELSGSIDKQWALSGGLRMPTLSPLLPELDGELSGKFRLTGDSANPLLESEWQGKKLRYLMQKEGEGDNASSALLLDSFYLSGQIPLRFWEDSKADSTAIADLALTVNHLHYQEHQLENAVVVLKGGLLEHQLTLQAKGEKQSVQLAVAGRWQDGQWHGRGLQGWIKGDLGSWQLGSPFDIQYQHSTASVVVDPHCWRELGTHTADSADGRFCLTQPVQWGEMRTVNAAVTDLPLSLFAEFYPQWMKVDGKLSGELALNWPRSTDPHLEMMLKSDNGALLLTEQQGDEFYDETLRYKKVEASLVLDATKLQAALIFDSERLGQGELRMETDLAAERTPLNGNVMIDGLQLKGFEASIAQIDELTGMLSAELTLGGYLDDPLLYGQIGLDKGSFSGGQLPMVVRQIDAQLHLQGKSARLDSELLVAGFDGDTKTTLTGDLNWLDGTPQGNFSLNGDALALHYNDSRLALSPSLELSLDESGVAISGELVIPYGRIKITSLPKGAVRQSDDVVVLSHAGELKKSTGIPLTLNVTVRLTDDVKIDAFGLKSNLKGNLVARQSKNRALSINGEMGLVDGTYKAWGQNLQIEKGQMIFSGPVDTPYLNIEAIRDPKLTADSVTVGLKITGRADQPEIAIFSDPSMEQQEAISYLLRGRALSSGSNSSADNSVAMMLLALGVGNSDGLVGKIEETFGVKDLSIETGGQTEDTLLEISGYILPGVEVRYGVTQDNNYQITVRYELLPKLFVEGRSGVESALDLLYEFEI